MALALSYIASSVTDSPDPGHHDDGSDSACLWLEDTTLALEERAVEGDLLAAPVADVHLLRHHAVTAHVRVTVEGLRLTAPGVLAQTLPDHPLAADLRVRAEDGRAAAVLVADEDVVRTVQDDLTAAHLASAVVLHTFAPCNVRLAPCSIMDLVSVIKGELQR